MMMFHCMIYLITGIYVTTVLETYKTGPDLMCLFWDTLDCLFNIKNKTCHMDL